MDCACTYFAPTGRRLPPAGGRPSTIEPMDSFHAVMIENNVTAIFCLLLLLDASHLGWDLFAARFYNQSHWTRSQSQSINPGILKTCCCLPTLWRCGWLCWWSSITIFAVGWLQPKDAAIRTIVRSDRLLLLGRPCTSCFETWHGTGPALDVRSHCAGWVWI
jgi:hypothetical protein